MCDSMRATAFGLATPDMTVTVSIGVATAADGTTLEELLIAADRRLYRAKASGRDRVVGSDGPLAVDTRPMPEAVPTDASTRGVGTPLSA
jgi:predicted signal transduction protein with EAL and GGDEF domain